MQYDVIVVGGGSAGCVLAALTHYTQPAQVQWIADITQLAVPQAQTALEDLADRALLVGDQRHGVHAIWRPMRSACAAMAASRARASAPMC